MDYLIYRAQLLKRKLSSLARSRNGSGLNSASLPAQLGLFLFSLLLIMAGQCGGQRPDLKYDTRIAQPTFPQGGPTVIFDEGHRNSHSSKGTYRPFTQLIRNDGYKVIRNKAILTPDILTKGRILVIANAKGVGLKSNPAFTAQEIVNITRWVEHGGGLFLIADHYPFGGAARELALAFGVIMSNGFLSDSIHYQGSNIFRDEFIFTAQNGLLTPHAITRNVKKVITFTGQSLKSPEQAVPILKLSPHAYEVLPDSIWTKGQGVFKKTYTRFTDPCRPVGDCQLLALKYGRGRVVIAGEAAAFTAQIAAGIRFGMNAAGNDNRQLTLNIMHWLSGLD